MRSNNAESITFFAEESAALEMYSLEKLVIGNRLHIFLGRDANLYHGVAER
jgi:hypothetical protein